jgi:hypothetical protein
MSLENSNNPQAFIIKPLKEEEAQLPNYLWQTSGMHRWYGRIERDTIAVCLDLLLIVMTHSMLYGSLGCALQLAASVAAAVV